MGVTMNITVSPVNGDSLDHRVSVTVFLVACIKKDPVKFEGYSDVGFATEEEAEEFCRSKGDSYPEYAYIVHKRNVSSFVKWAGEGQ